MKVDQCSFLQRVRFWLLPYPQPSSHASSLGELIHLSSIHLCFYPRTALSLSKLNRSTLMDPLLSWSLLLTTWAFPFVLRSSLQRKLHLFLASSSLSFSPQPPPASSISFLQPLLSSEVVPFLSSSALYSFSFCPFSCLSSSYLYRASAWYQGRYSPYRSAVKQSGFPPSSRQAAHPFRSFQQLF